MLLFLLAAAALGRLGSYQRLLACPLRCIDSLRLNDFASGVAKTPFFGFLIGILGCYFGLQTRGGTEGVGRSTTRAVVVVSISILMADALLTQIFVSFGTL